MLISPSRRFVLEKLAYYYPFSSNRVRNVVKDYCGSGNSNIKSVKILFLGCGDLMDTLLATTAENIQQFQIHLNDKNPSIMARNIMMLKIISARDFNPEKDEDLNFLWDIWYNATWPEITRKRFLGVLKDLANEKLPQNVIIPEGSHLQSVKKIWSAWRKSFSENHFESTTLFADVLLERILFIWAGWCIRFPEEFVKEIRSLNGDFFTAAINGLVEEVENHIGIDDLTDHSRQKIRDEIWLHFENGDCRVKKTYDVCVNPTMLNPIDQSWQVFHSPFDSYLPLDKEELSSSSSCILIRSCQKILKNLVYSYRIRVQDINVVFHLKDALEFCYSNQKKFDIIHCSDLGDQLGLVNVINACGERLAEDPRAMLFTETLNWPNLSSSVEEYVEKSLFAPLSMIPTIYGLRLVDRVELGASALVNLRCKIALPVHLSWKKVPPFKNLTPTCSLEMDRFLNHLAKRCFDISFPRKLDGTYAGDACGMLCYTPLTFDYVVNSLINRVGGGDCWMNDERKCGGWRSSNLFDLTKRTARAWKKGQPILNLTAKIQTCLGNTLDETATLRLVLVPCVTFHESISKGEVDISGPGIHIIDNFKIETKKVPDGSEIIIVSFLLVADHGLENTHLALLMDLEDGTASYVFKPLRSMRSVKFRQPHPFSSGRPEKPHFDPPGQLQMVVFSCTESANDYQLKISIPCGDTVSGVNVSVNQRKPCESAHDIAITPDQPSDIEPLTLSFPHPILVKEIHFALHKEARLISIVLKKALLEPWPQEFEVEQTKWNPDQLKPWEETKERVCRQKRSIGIPSLSASCLAVHVACQFNLHQLPKPSKMEKSDLNAVRDIITILFQNFVGDKPPGISYVHILLDGSTEVHSDWYLKIHQPVLTSPQGSPMLLVSAFDSSKFFEAKKTEEKTKEISLKNDFFRVFPSWKSDEKLTIKADRMELLKLLRFVLRSNSTKIKPTTWQKNHLPLEENSPWLATFISPLYLDAPLDTKKVKPNLFFSLTRLVIFIVIICAVLYAIGFVFLNVLSYVF